MTIAVLNASTLAISEYNLNPVEILGYNNEIYFLNNNSLDLLDKNIQLETRPKIVTGVLSFNTDKIKYLDSIQIQCSTDSDLDVKCFIDTADGDVFLFPSKEIYRDGVDQHLRLFKFPKGIRSQYWGFIITTNEESKLQIQDITLNYNEVDQKR